MNTTMGQATEKPNWVASTSAEAIELVSLTLGPRLPTFLPPLPVGLAASLDWFALSSFSHIICQPFLLNRPFSRQDGELYHTAYRRTRLLSFCSPKTLLIRQKYISNRGLCQLFHKVSQKDGMLVRAEHKASHRPALHKIHQGASLRCRTSSSHGRCIDRRW